MISRTSTHCSLLNRESRSRASPNRVRSEAEGTLAIGAVSLDHVAADRFIRETGPVLAHAAVAMSGSSHPAWGRFVFHGTSGRRKLPA
jgi:hypothetical protein